MPQEIRFLESESQVPELRFKEEFALDVLVGLSEKRKAIPSIYLYDDKGSEYFKQITRLEEYYPTNCEIEVLQNHSAAIAELAGKEPLNLVEFGPGDGSKTKLLIKYLIEKNVQFQYVPIDISKGALDLLIDDFALNLPEVDVCALVSDFTTGMKWLNQKTKRKNLVLFLGSNIGNFSHHQARLFLRNLWMSLNQDDAVLIGFDLKKDIEMLLSAYNDKEGVTAKFNLNVLYRINRELGGQFELDNFRYYSTYNVFSGAMESFLVSLVDQNVGITAVGRTFDFRQWEPIHTEHSYKYLESDISLLAIETGFHVLENFYDQKKYYLNSFWEVTKY